MSANTKSKQVRTLIHVAKSNGATEVTNELIVAVMAELGFKRQLARAYVMNNWAKVEVVAVPAIDPKLAAKRAKDAAAKRAKRAAAKAAEVVAA